MVPSSILSPFIYVMDITKDSIQVVLLITAVGGFKHAFRFWYSFSSVVSMIKKMEKKMKHVCQIN
jgi:hypothetical protein